MFLLMSWVIKFQNIWYCGCYNTPILKSLIIMISEVYYLHIHDTNPFSSCYLITYIIVIVFIYFYLLETLLLLHVTPIVLWVRDYIKIKFSNDKIMTLYNLNKLSYKTNKVMKQYIFVVGYSFRALLLISYKTRVNNISQSKPRIWIIYHPYPWAIIV